MLDEMTLGQWDDWRAYDRLEPVGNEKLYVLLAFVVATVANQRRDPDSEPVTPWRILEQIDGPEDGAEPALVEVEVLPAAVQRQIIRTMLGR